jgi:colanic acid/amylovoran biosynthesis glycosyltransferase
MKIAYFVNQYPLVSLTFVRREILALEAMGQQVRRFALRGWDAPLADSLDKAERDRTSYVLGGGAVRVMLLAAMECLRSPGRFLRCIALSLRMSSGGDRTVFHHLFSVAEAAVLARELRRCGAEHLHAHFGTNSAEVAMHASLLAAVPYSFTVHGPDEWDRAPRLKFHEKLRYARFAVAISQYTRAQMMRWVPAGDRHRIHVVHCGLDDDLLGIQVAQLPLEPVIVCVGRLCPAKAQHVLVEAIAAVRKQGFQVKLVLVGDGELRSDIERSIRESGLEQSVTITGWASSQEVRTRIEGARAFVLPSLAEGLPVAIMEAMALGRPVISTYVGGIAELIRPGTDGWLVPAGDVQALAGAIIELLQMDAQTLQQMSVAAKARVSERHSISREAGRLLRLFSQGAPAPLE